MMLIEWTAELEVGVDGFDEQHRKLIDIMNDLSALVAAGAAKDEIAERFDQLDNYARFHFKTEAEYFEMIDYPEASGHILAHNSFVRQLDDMQMTMEAGLSLLSDKEMALLRDWLISHIQGLDRLYGNYIGEDAAWDRNSKQIIL